ncbi:MAG: glycosyl hydrolase [Spirochaetales bacterium]|nr:glycosyl hydrolase [Spirochaetales bacterium]
MKEVNKNIPTIISQMTLEQKAHLCSGKDFWHLVGFENLGIPSIMVTDGPHGLRKQVSATDHMGLNNAVPAVCFPTAAAMAASWDVELIEGLGRLLAEECRQEKVAVLLGPGVNIKRSPLGGRNFEYFSEDPYLSGKLATAFIRGVQSLGIGTSLKHFVANNQEHRRMTIDTLVDDRALREIYLAGFEKAVKEAQPTTVMSAYNRLNGEYCSENPGLLTTILKEEWGFQGFVVTDWGANNDRVAGLRAGQDLEMPGPVPANTRLIVEAVQAGQLSPAVLDLAVERILKVIFSTARALEVDSSANFTYDEPSHQRAAADILAQSAVLLKNRGALPLEEKGSVAIIGEFAKLPRYQGSGSSLIQPTRLDNAWDSIVSLVGDKVELSYARGYEAKSEEPNEVLIAEAVELAKKSGKVVIFVGLPDISESEGFDRQHLDLPRAHNRLVEEVARVNPRCVVVLSNGSPVTMPWIDQVDAILETYLGGQAWGTAVAELLFGRVNPSGKLAETFPLCLEDVPSSVNFPGGTNSVAYAESVYVGYRYYDTTKTEVLFPFGHGLSYTTFDYHGLLVSGPDEEGNVEVRFTLTNTGTRSGKEVVQVYVHDPDSTVFRPKKELKGFFKVILPAGEFQEVSLTLDRRAFCFWDSGFQDWKLEAGNFEILVGASSTDIRLSGSVAFTAGDALSPWARTLAQQVPGYYRPSIETFVDLGPEGEFSRLLGRPIPPKDTPPGTTFTRTSTLGDIRRTFVGGILYWAAQKQVQKMAGPGADEKTLAMMRTMVAEMPLRNLATMGKIDFRILDGIIALLNGWKIRRRQQANGRV